MVVNSGTQPRVPELRTTSILDQCGILLLLCIIVLRYYFAFYKGWLEDGSMRPWYAGAFVCIPVFLVTGSKNVNPIWLEPGFSSTSAHPLAWA